MYLNHEEGKLNFIIGVFTSTNDEITGGVIVLHKLAKMLADRGHSVYVFCEPKYPHPNIKIINSSQISQDGFAVSYTWENFSYPYHTTISIYPQTTWGNWFNTQHVTRWILYDTQKDIENMYGENDEYFNFGTFKTFRDVDYRPLTVFDFNFDKLYNLNIKNRKSFCHIIHKHTPENGEKIFDLLGSENLTNWKKNGGYDYLREKLNEYEYFLTYDQKTFYTLAAGLCGTKSIILNPGPTHEFLPNANSESKNYNRKILPIEYRVNNNFQMFGVAYGWDDLFWAEKTIDIVPDYLRDYEKMSEVMVDNFINFWLNKIYGK